MLSASLSGHRFCLRRSTSYSALLDFPDTLLFFGAFGLLAFGGAGVTSNILRANT